MKVKEKPFLYALLKKLSASVPSNQMLCLKLSPNSLSLIEKEKATSKDEDEVILLKTVHHHGGWE